jgi:hypothetical protein
MGSPELSRSSIWRSPYLLLMRDNDPPARPAQPGPAAAQPAAPARLPVAVVDIDGVVADVRHRVRYLELRPRDWDAFFGAAADDPPLAAGLARVAELARGHEIVWLTGRPEWLRDTTLAWFRDNGLPAGRLIMRRAHDRRPAKVVKRAELRRLAADRTVQVVIDDDPAVVAALAADGWPVERADWLDYAPELGTAQEESGRT